MATATAPAPAPAASAEPTKERSGRKPPFVRYLVLIGLALLFISPLLFMLVTSFKTRSEATAVPPTWVPENPTGQAYSDILNASDTPVLTWFVNSLLAATANSALVVATAALAAYPLARMDFRGKKFVLATIIATLFVPPVILMVLSVGVFWLFRERNS